MKRPAIVLGTALILFTSPVLAQEDAAHSGFPQPAKELEKFSKLIGYWQGEGTAAKDASSPMMKWTSSSHVRKVLGGHFLREDVRIDGEGWPAPMQFITFYGYDQHKKRFINIGISNMGTAEIAEVTFQDDNTMITAGTRLHMGKRVVDRWVTKLGDGKVGTAKSMFSRAKISFVGHQAIGDGDFFVHVKGTVTRIDGKPKAKIVDASASMGEPTTEMGKLKGLIGTMRFKGEMLIMPGSPMMPISGESITEPLFGGTVLKTIINGDEVQGQAYHGWHALVWNPTDKNYVSIGVNNMGEVSVEKGTWASDTELLFTCSRPYYGGIPSVHSGVMKCAADGSVKSYTSHSIIGTHKPVKSFHIDYTKK